MTRRIRMSRMMIYINYPLSSQLTKFVTVTLTFVTVSYIVSYVRNQPESYTLTSLLGTIIAGWFPPFRSQGHQSDTGKWQPLRLASRLLKAWSISMVGVICGGSKKKDVHFRNLLTTSTCPKQSRKMGSRPFSVSPNQGCPGLWDSI